MKAEIDSLPEPLLRQMVGGTPNDGLATMRQQLFELRVREQEVLSKFTPMHPIAISIREQVREVEEALKREEPDRQQLISALSAQEVANRASLAVQKEKLQTQLAELNSSLVALNENEIVIEELMRKEQQLETKYLAYVENTEEARMDQALRTDKISNVSIIQPATFEPTPVSPRKAVILALALVVGCLGGYLVVLLSDQLDPTPRTGENAAANLRPSDLSEHSRRPVHELALSGGNGNGNGVHAEA